MTEVALLWVDEDGHYNDVFGPVDPQDAAQGSIVVADDVPDGPAAGMYYRLTPDQEAVITSNKKVLPIFLRSDWVAYEETYMRQAPGEASQAVEAEAVRQHLEDVANLAVKKGRVSLSPILTMSVPGPAGDMVLHGVVIMARLNTPA